MISVKNERSIKLYWATRITEDCEFPTPLPLTLPRIDGEQLLVNSRVEPGWRAHDGAYLPLLDCH